MKYINGKQEKYKEGKRYNPDQLMQLADNKFRLLKEKGIWDTPSESEEKILALEAKIAELTRSTRVTKASKRKKSVTEDDHVTKSQMSERKVQAKDKLKWMFQRPKEEDLRKPRSWNGSQWRYCHKDTGGKYNVPMVALS